MIFEHCHQQVTTNLFSKHLGYKYDGNQSLPTCVHVLEAARVRSKKVQEGPRASKFRTCILGRGAGVE